MNENKIIRKCQKHDLRAYKMIYDRYNQPLLHTAMRMLGHKQDAEDAVQMTFLRLYRGIQRFRYDSKFSTYLFRILMNVCFDFLEKRDRIKMQALKTENLSYHPKNEYELQGGFHAKN